MAEEKEMKKHLVQCPACSGTLKISQYHCPECGIDINGEFEGCMFCDLDDEDRYFALVFLQTGGNISDVEKVMGISYPTVKAKLARLLDNLGVSPEFNGGGEAQYFGDGRTHRFGDRMKRRHAQREDRRKLKDEIRETVRSHVKASLKGAMAGIPFVSEDEEPVTVEVPPKKNPPKDFGSIIGDLKEGRIDVASALRRIKGEDDLEQLSQEGEPDQGEKVE
jgi:hypothetical protein